MEGTKCPQWRHFAIGMPWGVLLWHRPWRQHSKVQPMRAQYLDDLDQWDCSTLVSMKFVIWCDLWLIVPLSDSALFPGRVITTQWSGSQTRAGKLIRETSKSHAQIWPQEKLGWVVVVVVVGVQCKSHNSSCSKMSRASRACQFTIKSSELWTKHQSFLNDFLVRGVSWQSHCSQPGD